MINGLGRPEILLERNECSSNYQSPLFLVGRVGSEHRAPCLHEIIIGRAPIKADSHGGVTDRNK